MISVDSSFNFVKRDTYSLYHAGGMNNFYLPWYNNDRVNRKFSIDENILTIGMNIRF